MRKLAVVLALALVSLVGYTTSVSADAWCAGGYDAKQGTNFGGCPGS